MCMFAQDRAFYRRVRVDETDDAEARRRLRIVEGIEEMRAACPAWFRAAAIRCAMRVGSGG